MYKIPLKMSSDRMLVHKCTFHKICVTILVSLLSHNDGHGAAFAIRFQRDHSYGFSGLYHNCEPKTTSIALLSVAIFQSRLVVISFKISRTTTREYASKRSDHEQR